MGKNESKMPNGANKTIIILLAGLMLFGGTAAARAADLPSPGILPGSPFFFVERFFEGIGNIFTFGQAAKAERAVLIAEKRLAAARILAARDDEDAQRAIALYEEKIAEAAQRAQNAQNANALARVAEATSKHFAVLEDVIERVPEQAKEAVRAALEFSKQGQTSALQALKGEDPSRAAEAGLTAVKAHAERVKASIGRGKPEDAEKAMDDFREALVFVSDAPLDQAALAAKFGEELTGIVEHLDEAKDAAPNIPAPVREKINQAKALAIDAQITSLGELAKEDPAKAVDIFAKAADARLNAAKRDAERNGEDTDKSLKDYEKYAQFGQEISIMAQGIRLEETTVEDLVKKATSHHLQVFEEVRQNLPSEARQEFQRAQDAARKTQELRPAIPAPALPVQPEIQLRQQPTPTPEQKQEVKREEVQQIIPGR